MSVLMIRKAKLREELRKSQTTEVDRAFKKQELDEVSKNIHIVRDMLDKYSEACICDYCNGTGEVQYIAEDGKIRSGKCTVCGGSGVVESNSEVTA